MRAIGHFARNRRAAASAIAVAVVAMGVAATVMARPDIPGAGKPGGTAVAPQPDETSTPGPGDPAALGICDPEEALCALPARFANNLYDGAAWPLEDRLLPSEAACSEAGISPVLRASACAGGGTGARAAGYTVTGLGKRPALLERQEFLDLVESWRALARGRDLAPLSVACGITAADTIDCQSAAVAVALRDSSAGPVDAVFVFFVRRDPAGNWGVVGASGGLPDGAVLTGGPERRLMSGWTGNPTGAWYFELLPPSP
ncbi:MAG: hypothetical protein AMXMBFR80_05920 [Dehalococcoidia bacterium]